MLWKLADNVKYEDDCEVSIGRGQGVSGGLSWPLRGDKCVMSEKNIILLLLLQHAFDGRKKKS